MKLKSREEKIVRQAAEVLGVRMVAVERPRQGMGSTVLVATDENGRQLAIKYGTEVDGDVRALELLGENRIDVPVPTIFATFVCEEQTVLVMEKIDAPLLEDVADEDKQLYIGSMVSNLKQIHAVKSDAAGPLAGKAEEKSWKELLLFRYGGAHPWFDWAEICRREGVDGELLRRAIAQVVGKIQGSELLERGYSLLHTDFNQRNLFVDVATHQVSGIIDWSEAMFGDPLYDFARVRMFIFHFQLGDAALFRYYGALKLTEAEREREELYLLSQIIDYIAWYAQKKNSFNDGRLRLHQDFLRSCGL